MKIIINSYPRSGSTMFCHAINWAVSGSELLDITKTPYSHNQNWIMSKHEHVILSGTYEDVMLCTILRDPTDAISSNVDRWFEGYVGSTIQGIQIKNSDQINSEHILNKDAKEFIDQEKELYMAYLIVINDNIDRITTFTYDQIKNNSIECINNIFSMFDMKDYQYNADLAKEFLTKPSSDKGRLYGEIRKYLEYDMNEIYTLYNQIMEKVSLKQKTYPIKLNPVIF